MHFGVQFEKVMQHAWGLPFAYVIYGFPVLIFVNSNFSLFFPPWQTPNVRREGLKAFHV